MPSIENAIALAIKAHYGQVDKAGNPYILHVLRVMLALDTETEMIAGVLHDVVEDSGYSLADLKKTGFSDEIITTLDCLTKRDSENYNDYIERIKTSPIALRVKLADLEDNMDISRLSSPCKEDISRLGKYKKAWLYLTNFKKGKL